jgi:hypothetical protein
VGKINDRLDHADFAHLSVPELRRLLNQQIGLKSKLVDAHNALSCRIGTYTTNIHNLRARIKSLSAKDEPVEVADHAILRYLERVKGIDLEALRTELDSEVLREVVQRCPTGRHVINGVTYVTRDKTLVTVIYNDEPFEL